MSIYTVHTPPADEAALDPERFEFIRDGFYFLAFVLGPLWLLMKRQWLALLIYVVVVAALLSGLWLIKVPPGAFILVLLLVHLLLGLEAASVQRWTFRGRRWTQLGVVSADRYEAAERRFFDSWAPQMSAPNTPAAPPPVLPIRVPPVSSDIIGLFPEPQSRQ